MADKEKLFRPHIPEVDIRPDIDGIFNQARKAAEKSTEDADGLYRRQVIIVTPGRLLIGKECPLPGELSSDEIQRLNQLIPIKPSQNIAVIAYTYLEALQNDILKAIPFFGYLMGFATIGHNVWVFEGHPSAISAGCSGADILIVDGGLIPELDENGSWQEVAASAMRKCEIKVIPRQNP
jgi:hypothetical protein